MSVAELPGRSGREKIAEFRRVRGLRKLSLSGSALRDDFDPAVATGPRGSSLRRGGGLD